jgi:hypothetical protein
MEFDKDYPGTAVQRLNSVHTRVKSLTPEKLNGDWDTVRRNLLWAGILSLFVYGCVYICILVYLYVYMYIYTCMYVSIYKYVYLYIYEKLNGDWDTVRRNLLWAGILSLFLQMYVYMYMYSYVYMSIYIYIYICTYICTYIWKTSWGLGYRQEKSVMGRYAIFICVCVLKYM